MGPLRKRLARALDKGRESKKLFVVGNGPVDLTFAIDRLTASGATYGIVGLLGDLQIEDPPDAQAPAQAPSKITG
jgi:hypothetical protein